MYTVRVHTVQYCTRKSSVQYRTNSSFYNTVQEDTGACYDTSIQKIQKALSSVVRSALCHNLKKQLPNKPKIKSQYHWIVRRAITFDPLGYDAS